MLKWKTIVVLVCWIALLEKIKDHKEIYFIEFVSRTNKQETRQYKIAFIWLQEENITTWKKKKKTAHAYFGRPYFSKSFGNHFQTGVVEK